MLLRLWQFSATNIGTCVAAAGLLLLPADAQAQRVPGSPRWDARRLAELTGDSSRADSSRADLLRSLPLPRRLRDVRLHGLGPDVSMTWNSALPYTLNDGVLWAGRGLNVAVTGGLGIVRTVRRGELALVLAPTLAYSENKPFQIFPDTTPDRSAFANYFHGRDASLDLPQRHGDRHVLVFHPGWSRLEYRSSRVAFGLTAADEWWGPGIRNALLVSSNAPGIPRVYARTATPLRTRFGRVTAELFSGTLTESMFFSELEADQRALSGARVEIRPAFDSSLTLGLGRVVYSPIGSASALGTTLARSFDALVRWSGTADLDARADQLYSLWGRWVFPSAGFELYGEWARSVYPANPGELLSAPHDGSAYTTGFQWAMPRGHDAVLRLQTELTWLEQSRVFGDRPPRDFYSGTASAHGYTNRGQVVGAAIGPGASSQWIALDRLTRAWRGGVFVGRIRWDNDALYRQPVANFLRHDVSVLAGVRGGVSAPHAEIAIELTMARRYNYLFQNGFANPGGYRTVDVDNLTLTLFATPR